MRRIDLRGRITPRSPGRGWGYTPYPYAVCLSEQDRVKRRCRRSKLHRRKKRCEAAAQARAPIPLSTRGNRASAYPGVSQQDAAVGRASEPVPRYPPGRFSASDRQRTQHGGCPCCGRPPGGCGLPRWPCQYSEVRGFGMRGYRGGGLCFVGEPSQEGVFDPGRLKPTAQQTPPI